MNFNAGMLLTLAMAGFLTHGLAQTRHNHRAEPAAKQASEPSHTLPMDGVVKKINRYTGRITVFHGTPPSGAPSVMEAYQVKDDAWLEQIKVGQRIRFTINQSAGAKTMVHFQIVECVAFICD